MCGCRGLWGCLGGFRKLSDHGGLMTCCSLRQCLSECRILQRLLIGRRVPQQSLSGCLAVEGERAGSCPDGGVTRVPLRIDTGRALAENVEEREIRVHLRRVETRAALRAA